MVFIKEAKSVKITAAQGQSRQQTLRLSEKVFMAGDRTGSSENTKEMDNGTDINKITKASHPGRPQYYNYQGYGHIAQYYVKAKVAAARVMEPSERGQAGNTNNKNRSEN